MVNIVKYTSPMDGMGLVSSFLGMYPGNQERFNQLHISNDVDAFAPHVAKKNLVTHIFHDTGWLIRLLQMTA